MNGYQRALQAVQGIQGERVPVVLWAIGQSYAPFAGIKDNEYYQDPEKMLYAQVRFHEYFPDVLTVPGLWPDFGGVAELGALGATVDFPENSPPHITRPALTDIHEAINLLIPNPRNADFTSQVLDYLKYFKKNTPEKLQKEYGYLDGHMFCMGPAELTALTLGYEKYSYALFEQPKLVHLLAQKITAFLKEYLTAQMEIVGPAKRIIVVDHLAGMISPQTYWEFAHPYLTEIFEMVSEAEIRLYHNENNYLQHIDYVKELPANVCHIGPKHNIAKDKAGLGKCVMGNLHPITDLLNGSEKDIIMKSKEIIKTAGKGGGLWLSTGGGMAPETPPAKMKLLIDVAAETVLGGEE